MDKLKIEEQINCLVDKLDSYSQGFYSEFCNKFCDDESLEVQIFDYAETLVDDCTADLHQWLSECDGATYYLDRVFDEVDDCFNLDDLIKKAQRCYYFDQICRDYDALESIRNLKLELEELASWNVIKDVKFDFKKRKN